MPALRGRYVYGDLCTGRIWSLRRTGGRPDIRVEAETVPQLVSFGEASDGELYVVSLEGDVHRLVRSGAG